MSKRAGVINLLHSKEVALHRSRMQILYLSAGHSLHLHPHPHTSSMIRLYSVSACRQSTPAFTTSFYGDLVSLSNWRKGNNTYKFETQHLASGKPEQPSSVDAIGEFEFFEYRRSQVKMTIRFVPSA